MLVTQVFYGPLYTVHREMLPIPLNFVLILLLIPNTYSALKCFTLAFHQNQ